MTFFQYLSSVNENSERESNPMLWHPRFAFIWISILVSFTDPNKQLPNVKSVFKSVDH